MQYPDINMSSRGISWSYVARSEFLVQKNSIVLNFMLYGRNIDVPELTYVLYSSTQ